MSKHLYIVESSVLGIQDLAKAASRLGYTPIILVDINNQEGTALQQIVTLKYIHCDTSSSSELINIINMTSEHHEVAGIITLLDSRLDVVSKVAHTLGLPGVDSAVSILKSKAVVNQLIPEYVPASIAVNTNLITESKIHQFLYENHNHIFLKPSFASGGKGVHHVRNIEEFYQTVKILNNSLPSYLKPEDIVMQAYIEGELISAEGWVYQGQVNFLGMTGRKKIKNTESRFIFPHDVEIDITNLSQIKKAINVLVKRANYRNGFFHTEFLVNKKQCVLIDANIGRHGGANIADLIAYSFDISLVEFYQAYLMLMLRQDDDLLHKITKKDKRSAIGIAYGLPEQAKLLSMTWSTPPVSKHIEAVNCGKIVPEMGDSNWSWVGLLSGSEKQVLDDLKNLKVLTDKGYKDPAYA